MYLFSPHFEMSNIKTNVGNTQLNIVLTYKSDFIRCNKKQASDYFIISSCVATESFILNCFLFVVLHIRHCIEGCKMCV